MCNPDRFFPVTRQQTEENSRAEKFLKIFETLRNIELDHPLLLSAVNERQGRTTQNFYQNKQGSAKNSREGVKDNQLAHYLYSSNQSMANQQIKINAINKA